MKKEKIRKTFYLNADTFEAIREMAYKEQINHSEIVENILNIFIKNQLNKQKQLSKTTIESD